MHEASRDPYRTSSGRRARRKALGVTKKRAWLLVRTNAGVAATERDREMTRQVDKNWKLQQQTTFTKWVNNALRGHLKTAKTQVNDLQRDLDDGLVLVELIESIASPRKVGRYNKNPFIKPQMLENLGVVLRFLEKEQIKVVNIGMNGTYVCVYSYEYVYVCVWRVYDEECMA